MANESVPGRWGPEQSARLHGLVEEGIVKTNDLSRDYILLVMNTHFTDRKYSSCAPLFRKKVCSWNLNGALSGARRAGHIPDREYVLSAGYLYDCQLLNMCVLFLSDTFLYLCPASPLTEEENP
jgi:hypothetical protein